MHALRKKTSALASYKLITEINTICKTEEHSSQNFYETTKKNYPLTRNGHGDSTRRHWTF